MAERRDADAWSVLLLDVAKQGLKPDNIIADAAQGLRTGRRAATARRAIAKCFISSASAKV
jgi:hypothetical protein